MAKSVAAGMKAAWEAAKKDFKENSHTDLLKQDVIDVLDLAKRQASIISKKSSSQPKLNLQSGKIGPKVNQDVGAELLTHFKEEWGEIHQGTETVSRVATKMEVDLRQLNHSITSSHVILNRCREEFGRLKEVVEALDEAQSKVECISELVSQVEEDIREYSRAKAELAMERQRHSLQRQHETTIMENREKVELLRKVLVNEQQLSLNLKHEMESSKLQERQDAFQEIFDKQMADYRVHGEVDKPIGQTRERSKSQLEEVVIEDEDGTASLHEFLSDVVDEDVPPEDDLPTEEGDPPAGAREEGDPPAGVGEEGDQLADDTRAKDDSPTKATDDTEDASKSLRNEPKLPPTNLE